MSPALELQPVTADRARWGREFFAPLPILAVAALAFNDHVLKRRAPGWLSGKLSDLALCFFLPLFVSALIGLAWPRAPRARLVAGALITALAFTLLELSDTAGAWFCAGLDRLAPFLPAGARCALTRDLTDLACLLVVPLAYAYGARRAADRRAR